MPKPAVNVAGSSTALDHRPDSPLTSLDGEDMHGDRPIGPPSVVATQTPTQVIAERASPDPAPVGYMLTASGAPIAWPPPADMPGTTDSPSASNQPADVPIPMNLPSGERTDSAQLPDEGPLMTDSAAKGEW